MDTISPERRSENMRRIRSQDTDPELIVRSLLHKLGYRFRLHQPDLPGRPDIVLRRLQKVILVHGCFWHQHKNCVDGRMPKSRRPYWLAKLQLNIKRDVKNRAALRRLGWRSLVIWDCQTHDLSRVRTRISRFLGR